MHPELLRMLKVKRSDLIPTKDVSQEAIDKKIAQFNSRAKSPKSQARLRKVLLSLNGIEITAPAFEAMLKKLDDFVAGLLPKDNLCKKGCGQCCHVNQSVSYIEAEYIAHQTGRSISLDLSKPSDGRCTFLDSDNLCSIYQHRPMVCRTFFTMDSWEACYVKDAPHYIHTLCSSPNLAEFHNHLAKSHVHSEGIRFASINQWFSHDGREQHS